MCGIIGVVRRRATRPPPALPPMLTRLDAVLAAIAAGPGSLTQLEAAARDVHDLDAALRGVPGIRALLDDPSGARELDERAERATGLLDALEARLDAGEAAPTGVELEALNATTAVAAATRSGRSVTTGSTAPTPSRSSPGPARLLRRSPASRPCRPRSRRSTASRCAAATRPVCTSSCGATDSTSTSPAWARAHHPHVGILSSNPGPCAPLVASWPSCTRLPRRSASSVTTPVACAPRSATTTSCMRPSPRTPPTSRCWATHDGPASGSSPRRTPIPWRATSSAATTPTSSAP